MDYKLIVETAVLAGKIMMESNAESYRVEETMVRILNVSKLETKEALAITTGLMVSLDDPSIDAITVVRRITSRSTNLNKIAQANTICRQFTSGTIDLQETYNLLKTIELEQYNPFIKDLGIILMAAFFSLLLGGKSIEIFGSGMNGFILVFLNKLDKNFEMDGFIKNVLSAFFVAIGTLIIQKYLFNSIRIDLVIASSIMPLVPGVAITNAFRDSLHGDYMSFGAKALEAVVVALAISVGVALGLILFGGVLS